jgi:hypothetical protein
LPHPATPSRSPHTSSPLMKLPRVWLCLSLIFSVLLGGRTYAQSSYSQYYPSGPVATMQADSYSTGFEIPLERTGHSFSFCFRKTASDPVSSSSAYPKGFITTGTGVGASAIFRSFLVTAYTPSSYVSTPYTYTVNGTSYTSYTYTNTPFSCVEWWIVDTTTNESTPHYSGTPARTADVLAAPWTNLGSGLQNRYFAVPDSRFGHALVAGSVQSGWNAVNAGYYRFGTYSNGTTGTQLPPAFFIGSIPLVSGSYSIGDRYDGMKAPQNQTNVINAAWVHDYQIYPLSSITLFITNCQGKSRRSPPSGRRRSCRLSPPRR